MINWTSIFSSGVDKVVDSVANGIDEIFTSDDERLAARNMLEKIRLESKLETEKIGMEFEKEITKRWTSDNEHIVTRLVRPISYIFVLVVFGIIIFADGNFMEFKVANAYYGIIETLLVTMTLGYFGSRGYEKGMKIKHGGK